MNIGVVTCPDCGHIFSVFFTGLKCPLCGCDDLYGDVEPADEDDFLDWDEE